MKRLEAWQRRWCKAQQEQAWQTLDQQQWDVLVIGGGITGAGIAREAAKRGLKVLLVERQDFAWGTSSRSSKMVHGGLRYLAAGDVATTLHSVRERERLMKEAPGLVDNMEYVMPHYRGAYPPALLFNLLLMLYDFFARHRYRRLIKAARFLKNNPYLKADGLRSVTLFADAVTDDSRLVMRVLREAMRDGACALNYVAAEQLVLEGNQVAGAQLNRLADGSKKVVRAKVVINATGAWADHFRVQLHQSGRIRPARGSHIVIEHQRLPVRQSFSVIHPQDQRLIFIYPWQGRTVIGTTDLDHPLLDNQEVGITEQEFQYLLNVVGHYFPETHLTAQDVISTWAGVRPLIASGKGNTSNERRSHSVWNDSGLITVSGGKLTTFRLIALDVLRAASDYVELPRAQDECVFSKVLPVQQPSSLNDAQWRRLQGYYGHDLAGLLACTEPDALDRILDTPFLWAELYWAAVQEAVQHLDDLLLRRTRLGLLLPDGAAALKPRLMHICTTQMHWSESQFEQEWMRYQTLWHRYYFVPGTELR